MNTKNKDSDIERIAINSNYISYVRLIKLVNRVPVDDELKIWKDIISYRIEIYLIKDDAPFTIKIDNKEDAELQYQRIIDKINQKQ